MDGDGAGGGGAGVVDVLFRVAAGPVGTSGPNPVSETVEARKAHHYISPTCHNEKKSQSRQDRAHASRQAAVVGKFFQLGALGRQADRQDGKELSSVVVPIEDPQ
jgi:hypothetical protein